MRDDLLWAKGLIDEADFDRFYGELTIIFESGRVIHAFKKESLKPKKNEEIEKKGLKFRVS